MTKRYSERDVHRALAGYRAHHDSIVHRLIPLIPRIMDTVATFNQDYMIATQIDRVTQGDVEAGTLTEKGFMCTEFFAYAGGKKPKDKPMHEVSLGILLDVERRPFVAVSSAKEAAEYLMSECQLERNLEAGKMLKSPHTWFLLYEEAEVLEGVDLSAFGVSETGTTTSIIKQRKKL